MSDEIKQDDTDFLDEEDFELVLPQDRIKEPTVIEEAVPETAKTEPAAKEAEEAAKAESAAKEAEEALEEAAKAEPAVKEAEEAAKAESAAEEAENESLEFETIDEEPEEIVSHTESGNLDYETLDEDADENLPEENEEETGATLEQTESAADPVKAEDRTGKSEESIPSAAGTAKDKTETVGQEQKDGKRVQRKNRRIRNQVICYVIVILLLIGAGFGTAWGFMTWEEHNRQKQLEAALNHEAFLEQVGSREEELKEPEHTPPVEEEPASEEIPESGENMPGNTENVTPTDPSEQQPEETQQPAAEQPVVQPQRNPEIEEKIDGLLEEMTLEEKVAGLFIITPEALTKNNTVTKAAGGTKSALGKYAVGGLIYEKKNIQSAKQVTDMISNTAGYAKYPLFMGIAEEGGSVGPLETAKLCGKQDSPKAIGEGGDATKAYEAGSSIGEAMSNLGFNVNFLSAGNIANVEGSVMEERSYGKDAASVIPYMTSMLQGLTEKKVTGVVGQFPGNGGTAEDVKTERAVSGRSQNEVEAEEFSVFRAAIAADVKMISVGTVAFPSYTEDNMPAVLSDKVVTDLLRKELHYDGIIITDALNVAAVTQYYSPEDAAVLALRAGCDMILLSENFEKAYNGVLQAVADGTISEARIDDAIRRIYRVKYTME